MTHDLKQLRDLVREMRKELRQLAADCFDCCGTGRGYPIGSREQIDCPTCLGARNAIIRADAIIGPGDGFPEVERFNREMSDE